MKFNVTSIAIIMFFVLLVCKIRNIFSLTWWDVFAPYVAICFWGATIFIFVVMAAFIAKR
jgi:hypothetical protein